MIKLVNLLQEAYVPEDMLKQLALEMGETITEFLGTGANGKAYLTQSGKVIKYTEDPAEVALATRLKTKRLYKHIVNVYDVRPIENLNGSYLILMDRINDPLDEHATWAKQWDYIRRRYFGNEETDTQFLKWINDTNGQWMKFDMDFINKIMPHRAGIKRDFSELRIVPDEAHSGNMGWNRHGNFVHFDAWQEEHYTKGYRTRFNGEPIRRDDGKLDTEINDIPYERGLSKPLQSFKDRNN
jgi:hypothetical protein